MCEKCNPAYSRLDSNIHRRENNIPEKEKLIDGFISVALAQTKQILYVPTSLALSPSPRLAQAVVSDCPATPGAEPAAPVESPVAVENGLSNEKEADVMVSSTMLRPL